jgi:hypothetical protein
MLVQRDAAVGKPHPATMAEVQKALDDYSKDLPRVFGPVCRPEDRLAGFELAEELEVELIHEAVFRYLWFRGKPEWSSGGDRCAECTKGWASRLGGYRTEGFL